MKCPNCNETEHEPTAKYCHVCGEALEKEQTREMSNNVELDNRKAMLEDHPFVDFPVVQRELMCTIGLPNFYEYYYGYRSILQRTKELSDYISRYLEDGDVKESKEYQNFVSKASQFFLHTTTVGCSDIKTVKDTGEMLAREASNLRSNVIQDRKKSEKKKNVKKNKRIASILTVLDVAFMICIVWLTLLSSYSERLSLFVRIVGLVSFGIASISVLLFLWSNEFLEK